MKRFLSLFLSMILAAGLCACGEKAPTWQEQYDLGMRYLSDGNYEEAIIAFTAAIEIDPKRADTYRSLAEAYMELGDYEKAVEVLKQGIDQTEDEDLRDLFEKAERMASIDFEYIVTDAYRDTVSDTTQYPTTAEWAVPKINLPGHDIEQINSEIWDSIYVGIISEELDYVRQGYSLDCCDVEYDWAVNEDILSVWIGAFYSGSFSVHWVYNVSIMTGERLQDQAVYSFAGFTTEEYYERAKQVMGSDCYVYIDSDSVFFNDPSNVAFFNEQLKITIAQENLEKAMPFLNAEGELCVIAPIYGMTDLAWNELNMENFTLVPDYEKGLEVKEHPDAG